MSNIKRGKYRHFKGKFYQVLHVATHTETHEDMVVYQALYGARKIWVRPAAMWTENVERDGYSGPRFIPVELVDDCEPFPKTLSCLTDDEVADALEQCIYDNCDQCPAKRCYNCNQVEDILAEGAKRIRGE